MVEYTVVEQSILQMKRILIHFQERLPEINFNANHSDETLLESVLKHKEILSELYEDIRNWDDEINKFESRVTKLENIITADTYLAKCQALIRRISDAVAVFFDDSTFKYKKVYIIDTCTLMHEPSAISWFDDDKALLIIPQVVLSELDGLKESNDETEAYNARETIRTISNYKAYDWLSIKEESHTELLPKDLDKNKSDNKILSIALKYIVKKPILLTDDINLRNIADSLSIESMDLHGYQNLKGHEHLDHSKQSKKKKKKK
jgi:rRNA-processing protein FCF1